MLFRYNRVVYHIRILLLVFIIILSAGCGANPAGQTATPDFATAVLPFTSTPVSTPTLALLSTEAVSGETSAPGIAPSAGTTTTQINVRAEPSTASETLGMIGIFTSVQVNGKDASGSWYQIVYQESANGNGWVRAEYVQVDAAAEIPVIGAVAGSRAAGSGLVIQKINVRSGPATTFESLGILSPNDVVFVTGKDSSGAWIQIEFSTAPNGVGWAASEFLQISNLDSLPIIGETEPAEELPADAFSTPITTFSAMEDGDSMQAPMAITSFSAANTRVLQITGDVSAPSGDTKDWIQFSTDSRMIVIEVICSNNALQMEVWNREVLEKTFLLACGEKLTLTTIPDNLYFLSLSEPNPGESQYTSYILKLESLR